MSTTVGDLLRIKGNRVETITAGETILEAIRRMSEKHIGCLAVVAKSGKLSGILSERDVLWKVIAEAKSPKTHLVKDAMTPLKQMKTVTPSQTVGGGMHGVDHGPPAPPPAGAGGR
jgi:CBS domain-containing protein